MARQEERTEALLTLARVNRVKDGGQVRTATTRRSDNGANSGICPSAMKPVSVLRKGETRNVDTKHVTFACSGSAVKQQMKKHKPVLRKRHSQEQLVIAKKAKHSELFERLHKCEETLVEVEYGEKVVEEKAITHRQTAAAVLNEVGECVCEYTEMDNSLVTLEEEIENLEALKSQGEHFEVVESENIVVSKNHEFDLFLTGLTENMKSGDPFEFFYDALPRLERMLDELILST
uniref:Ovate family protein n=1 Tax=Angiostrongylus cantonensis TaxID=6313 RepID=A0A0K0DL06_ANGCA